MNERELFYQYYNKWREETLVLSNAEIIFNNQWFKKIVEMGEIAVPFIKEVLIEGDNFIVYALDKIFPDLMEYKGYVSLKQACRTWLSILIVMNY